MFYAAMKRALALFLALVSFFVNLTTKPSANDTPADAVSVVYADTVYGDLKLFLPEDVDARKPTDVILMLHGGAWVSGGAFIFYDDCRAAAKAGYIAASMNYDKIFNGASAADIRGTAAAPGRHRAARDRDRKVSRGCSAIDRVAVAASDPRGIAVFPGTAYRCYRTACDRHLIAAADAAHISTDCVNRAAGDRYSGAANAAASAGSGQ